jgi:hypothetical protein
MIAMIAEHKSSAKDCVDTPVLKSKPTPVSKSTISNFSKNFEIDFKVVKKPAITSKPSNNCDEPVKVVERKEQTLKDFDIMKYVDNAAPLETKSKEKEQPLVTTKVTPEKSESSRSLQQPKSKQQQECVDAGEELIRQILLDLKQANLNGCLAGPGKPRQMGKEEKDAVAHKIASDLLVLHNTSSNSKNSPITEIQKLKSDRPKHPSVVKSSRLEGEPSSSELDSDRPRVRFCKIFLLVCIFIDDFF